MYNSDWIKFELNKFKNQNKAGWKFTQIYKKKVAEYVDVIRKNLVFKNFGKNQKLNKENFHKI